MVIIVILLLIGIATFIYGLYLETIEQILNNQLDLYDIMTLYAYYIDKHTNDKYIKYNKHNKYNW